jgi:hypothetical protein
MKILLYTISDFKDKSVECIDLLLSSIIFDMPTDFLVITNDTKNSCAKYPLLIDNSLENNYVGYLKYSYMIPEKYDYYIYLDSDILYFDKISKLINFNKHFTIVTENTLIGKNYWWYFDKVSENENVLLQNSIALNAGSFCFDNSKLLLIKYIQNTYSKYYTKDASHNAMLEQSIFNYTIHKNTNFVLDNTHDITDFVQLFAGNSQISHNKKLYHFCGFTNEMHSKYNQMKKLYDTYISSK